MLDNPLLGTAIGLAFLFLLLSVITTTLQELIASWLNLRGRNLLVIILDLIKKPEQQKEFLLHPKIYSLFTGELKTKRPIQWVGNLLSSILTFSYLPGGAYKPNRMPSYIEPSSFAEAALALVPRPAELPESPTPEQAAAAATAAAAVSIETDGAAIKLIATLRAASKTDDEISKELVKLFEATTERVSGWFKRQSQWISLLLGLGVAASINADSIHIARMLWGNDSLREGISTAAENFVAANKDAINNACEKAIDPANEAAKLTECEKAFDDLKVKVETITSAGYPIGWKNDTFLSFQDGQDPTLGIIGIVLTALAISLGNNFWFDLLSKFLSFRGTGKKEDPK